LNCEAPSIWHPLDRAAVLATLAVSLLALIAWHWLATAALTDDGSQLVQDFSNPRGLPLWFHVLYFPSAGVVRVAGARPDQALWLVSAISGAAVVGSMHAAAFVLTGRRWIAAATALGLLWAPGLVEHATIIEVHALHAAVVSLVVLALLLARGRPRRVVLVLFLGSATAVWSHRSGALAAPAFALLALAVLAEERARPLRRVAIATAGGVALGYLGDELLHRWIGGPTVFESLLQVRGASASPSFAGVWHEVLRPLGVLWLGVWLVGCGRSAGWLLVFVPGTALLCHGLPTALAAINTRGGYCLCTLPFLALGLALQLQRLHRPWSIIATAAAFLLSAWLSIGTLAQPWRTQDGALRQRRIALARASLPAGGEIYSMCPGRQYVDGAVAGVSECDVFEWLGSRLAARATPEQIRSELFATLTAAMARGPVVWTREWRAEALPPAAAEVLTGIDAAVQAHFMPTAVAGTDGRAWQLR
jgi:hypothetical protein